MEKVSKQLNDNSYLRLERNEIYEEVGGITILTKKICLKINIKLVMSFVIELEVFKSKMKMIFYTLNL